MRVFLDENMPRPLRHALAGHEVSYVEKEGWKGKENGELLALVEGRFDVILTSDGNIAYQQTLA
ncbi:PIN-like domain-containing protein [Methylorubrum thiocyanatum]